MSVFISQLQFAPHRLADVEHMDAPKAKGWCNDAPLPPMQECAGLESAAKIIKTWQVVFVPGLLQPPTTYAR
ncbi:hypothetical protein AB0I10_18950 [Streptomyces sp. NPDC050636]|uniref:hypothetical protein n=1 Tax=Streptomyces sp. NPDC050636 TaxID=3154510 RepID=UPI00343A5E0B